MIDIRNFVKIDIEADKTASENGFRPTVALCFSTAFESSAKTDEKNEPVLVGANSDYSKFYDENGNEVNLAPTTVPYAKIFFANGGARLALKNGTIANKLASMGNDIIVIAQAGLSSSSAKTALGTTLSGLKGLNRKLVVTRDTLNDAPNTLDTSVEGDYIISKASGVTGAEMSVCAYLSKMKPYKSGSPVDYDFTEEFEIAEDGSSSLNLGNNSVTALPYNFEMRIGNKYLNIGGNTISGKDIVEQYVIIIMEQLLTNRVFTALSSKLSGQSGLSAIRTAIASELDKFTNSGFLSTEQVWTKADLVLPNAVDANKPSETVITKNTPLGSGYHIHMFRLSSDGRKAYAVIVLATTKGIRFVEVYGKTI